MDDDLLTLARLARLLERACGELQPPLTLAQFRLLAMIGSGADRASHLAGQLALAKPTVSATVDTLVERGLVERASSRDDRRVTTLTVTDHGRRELAAAEAAMRARLDDVLARIDDPVAVSGALDALRSGLDERRSERRAVRRAEVRSTSARR
ncbi:MAG TPA: MarR family transcriptional regulator [Acidimicrobiia bacterium]|jgi:DNA-binding MarR family transcriptional regulator